MADYQDCSYRKKHYVLKEKIEGYCKNNKLVFQYGLSLGPSTLLVVVYGKNNQALMQRFFTDEGLTYRNNGFSRLLDGIEYEVEL